MRKGMTEKEMKFWNGVTADDLQPHKSYKESFEYEIDYYYSIISEIESIRLDPSTTDDEKWEKIGEITKKVLKPTHHKSKEEY